MHKTSASVLVGLTAACAGGPAPAPAGGAGAPAAAARAAPACRSDNAGLTLPAGFCALLVADSVGPVRHLAVTSGGDVIAAVRGNGGGVIALRDTTGDGRADIVRRFGPSPGSGLALAGGYLYFAPDDAVVRWRWADGQLEPAGAPDTVVSGLVNRRQHAAKTIAVGAAGAVYVNIGAPSNACQATDRQPGVAGLDPCPLLDSAGGIWRFDGNRVRQSPRDGVRHATGLRNVVGIALDPATGVVYGAQHGRDDLARFWPALYTEAQSAERPAEELFRLEEGGNYGWPYCMYDPELRTKILNPEYGGDGRTVGRCGTMRAPLATFPAHWAPNAVLVYRGSSFPAEYRGGIFVAFHGSWNRAPLPQQGFNVVFVPMDAAGVAGPWRVFAEGFRPAEGRPSRPTGLAVGPDGSLYVSDDSNGRIYRIMRRP